ncbi:T9SS type A sorting domain-containing protein [candidate division TA06 bacterium]|nr:T9SS type A sorting domain-containing protein [candidate division TA06 bacterium]
MTHDRHSRHQAPALPQPPSPSLLPPSLAIPSFKKTKNRQPTAVRLVIYDITGRMIRTLVDEEQEMGDFTIEWDWRDELGKQALSGIYFFTLAVGEFEAMQKVILLK